MKPYCKSCWSQTIREEYYDIKYEEILISDYKKRKLRKKFLWIKHIKGDWEIWDPCYYCGKMLDSYIWYFGDKKCCCSDCFEKECKKRKIITDVQVYSKIYNNNIIYFSNY